MRMKKFAFLVFIGIFAFGMVAVGGARGEAAETQADPALFVVDGETDVQVARDSETIEPYPAVTQKASWKWYTYDEYEAHVKNMEFLKGGGKDPVWGHCSGMYAHFIESATRGAERDPAKLRQTLADIQNGIKVSRPKLILVATNGKWTGMNLTGWVNWYCYGYTFKDAAGKEVDLGLFETRDELFGALRQYYDEEIASGSLTKAEADGLYSRVAHNVRNVDEVPLTEKLLHYKSLYQKPLYNPFYFEG